MKDNRFLRAGTVLVPKPEWKHLYKDGFQYIVTEDDEKKNATVGERWMVIPVAQPTPDGSGILSDRKDTADSGNTST